ncbi:MAG: Ig-like domain-containing protein [Isosphaeraceae bacterium]
MIPEPQVGCVQSARTHHASDTASHTPEQSALSRVEEPGKGRAAGGQKPALRVLLLVLLACAVEPAPARAQTTPGIGGHAAETGKGFVWQVSGLDPADLSALRDATRDPKNWPKFFRVRARPIKVDAKAAASYPDMNGTPRVEGTRLEFHTRYAPEEGMAYDFMIDLSSLPGRPSGKNYELTFEVRPSAPSAPTTSVARVAPASGLLPENLLKFYIEFSAPMSRGEAYEHLHLLDASGKPIDLPFLELGEELWDREHGMRFTVLFDPGRIKSGLKPREEAGPVLEAGKTYTLVIDAGWHDATGRPLVREFRKTFRVGPTDSTPPDPAKWALTRPPAGGKQPLVVKFGEPLDRWITRRGLGVTDPAGKPVPGTVAVSDDETSATFVPEKPWKAGPHQLLVDRTIEDLAGNNPGRPFEVDVFQKIEAKTSAEFVKVPFTVD